MLLGHVDIDVCMTVVGLVPRRYQTWERGCIVAMVNEQT